MSEVPIVKDVFGLLTPDSKLAAAPVLVYPNLQAAVAEHIRFDPLRRKAVMEAEGFAQDKARLALSKQHLIEYALAAATTLNPEWQEYWAQKYTQASIEWYGAPDPVLARSVLAAQYIEMTEARGNPKARSGADWLLNRYDQLGIEGNAELVNNQAEVVWKASQILAEGAEAEFGDILKIFEGPDGEKLIPEKMAELTRQAFELMGKTIDPRWGEAEVVMVSGTKYDTNESKWQVQVGRKRQPATHLELRGLFGHEVLWHMLRYHNGCKLSGEDDIIKKGLPGYFVIDEGGGKIIEFGLSGSMPNGREDRYGDIALALGIGINRPVARPESSVLAAAREIVRLQAASEDYVSRVDLYGAQSRALIKVNRVYRGSRGDHNIGVFTKDITYLDGQIRLAPYIIERKDQGATPVEIFKEVTCARFDPTKAEHREYIKNLSLD